MSNNRRTVQNVHCRRREVKQFHTCTEILISANYAGWEQRDIYNKRAYFVKRKKRDAAEHRVFLPQE